MATYTVNMSNVAAVAEEMQAIAGQIQSLISELESGTASSLQDWTSSAQDAYRVAKAKWDTAAQGMADQANAASSSLSQITDAYANAEYQGLGLWS